MIGWIWVEKQIWGSWPPPLMAHYLHLIRGVLIAFITSLVAVRVILHIKREDTVLKERVSLFLSAFEHSTDAMLLTNLGGIITDINPAFTLLFGYTREEAVGQTTRILRSNHSTDAFYRAMWKSITAKDEWKGEIINRAKDGRNIPIWLSITPVVHRGQKIGYMGIEMDMREKKDLERRALEAERLAAVGKISSQVAHEVRNPLSSISLNAELLREELDTLVKEPNPVKIAAANSLLQAIEREVGRLSELAGDYLTFSRLPKHHKQSTDLNELVMIHLDFLREEARRRGIEVLFHPCAGLSPMSVDPRQLEQVLLNLVKNALEAMPEGGRVEVRVAKEDHAVVLSVRDEGTGMDEETRKKIFDPFFTTKERGTGLGLSLVQQVVDEHGGEVWCESGKAKGTTFFIRIPWSAGGALEV